MIREDVQPVWRSSNLIFLDFFWGNSSSFEFFQTNFKQKKEKWRWAKTPRQIIKEHFHKIKTNQSLKHLDGKTNSNSSVCVFTVVLFWLSVDIITMCTKPWIKKKRRSLDCDVRVHEISLLLNLSKLSETESERRRWITCLTPFLGLTRWSRVFPLHSSWVWWNISST